MMRSLLLVAPVLLFALTGCGACDAFEPLDVPLPDVEVTSLDGAPIELASLKGQPLVLHLFLPT